MSEEYQLIEQTKKYRQPVGSVVNIGGQRTIYRNIDDKHIFKKGDYQAMFMDSVVIDWLSKNDPQVIMVCFDYCHKKTYTVGIEKFIQAKPRTMSGRLQRGVTLTSFIEGQTLGVPRPQATRVIEVQ